MSAIVAANRSAVAAIAVTLLVSLAGCIGDDPDPTPPESPPAGEAPAEAASPLDDCTALAGPPPQAPDLDSAASGAEAEVESLPSLTLPCFTGAAPVALDELPGPAVVNLWASWCGPCREELPVLQEFAEDTADRVHVVGVITRDTQTAAAAFADDAGVTFPGIYDRDGQLHDELPGISLPVTLFVDADGRVRHLHSLPVNADELEQLAAEHLGVTR